MLTLANDQVKYTVVIDSNRIIFDELALRQDGLACPVHMVSPCRVNADFKLEIMWTDWQAPKYLNNAENPVWLTKSDFRVKHHEILTVDGGTKDSTLFLESADVPVMARLR